jgi:hypothetical protein
LASGVLGLRIAALRAGMRGTDEESRPDINDIASNFYQTR